VGVADDAGDLHGQHGGLLVAPELRERPRLLQPVLRPLDRVRRSLEQRPALLEDAEGLLGAPAVELDVGEKLVRAPTALGSSA